MHSLIMFLRNLVALPYQLFTTTSDIFTGMWSENARSRSLLLGMPAIVAIFLCLATLAWANLGSQPKLESRYDGLAQSAKQRSLELKTELDRERQILGTPPEGNAVEMVGSDQSDIRQKKLEDSWQEERVYLQKLISLNPSDPDYKYRLAQVHLKQGDLQRGVSMMRALAPMREAKFGKAHFWMANFIANQPAPNSESKRKMLIASLAQIDNCLIRDNSNTDAEKFKGALLLALKRPREASEIYEKLFNEDPVFYTQLLNINRQLRQPMKSETVIDRAVIKFYQQIREHRKDTKKWIAAWQHYNNLLREGNEFEKAETELQRELEEYADDSGRQLFLKRQLSVIYSMWASYIEVEDDSEETDRKVLNKLKKSIENGSRNEDALRQLTRLSKDSVVADEAKAIYDAELDDNAPAAVCAELGTQALTNADYNMAIQHFENAKKKKPRDSRVLNNLAYTYLVCENRNPERALNLANDAIRFRPTNVDGADLYRSHFLHTRGLALMQLNQMEEAAANFEVALQDRADSENILKDLIKCYEGRMEDQAEIYRRKLQEVIKRKGAPEVENENNPVSGNGLGE